MGDVVGLGIDPEAQASCTGSLTPSGLPAPVGGTAVVPQGLTVGGAYVGSSSTPTPAPVTGGNFTIPG